MIKINISKVKPDHLYYNTIDTEFGKLLVAKSKNGICFVSLGYSEDILINQLKQQFKASIIEHDKKATENLLETLLSLGINLDSKKTVPVIKNSDIILDLYGTDFQIKVWQALLDIPKGKTVSYSNIAVSIDKPKAYRAVANAIAQNPIALFIPCHRIIGADGNLRGYRWGKDLKYKLLVNECAIALGSQ